MVWEYRGCFLGVYVYEYLSLFWEGAKSSILNALDCSIQISWIISNVSTMFPFPSNSEHSWRLLFVGQLLWFLVRCVSSGLVSRFERGPAKSKDDWKAEGSKSKRPCHLALCTQNQKLEAITLHSIFSFTNTYAQYVWNWYLCKFVPFVKLDYPR